MSINLIREQIELELDDVLTDIHELVTVRDQLAAALDALGGTSTTTAPDVNGEPVQTFDSSTVVQVVGEQPAATPPPTVPKPQQRSRGAAMDYGPIAKVYNELVAAGHPTVYAELARRCGVTVAAAKNYPPRMRKLGLIPDASRKNVAPVAAAAVEQRVVTENPARLSVTTVPTPTDPGHLDLLGYQCDEDGCGYKIPGESSNCRNLMRSHIRLNHSRNGTTLELMAGVLV